MSIFITATDTNAGKTMTSAGLMKAFANQQHILYYKPIQTGDDDDRATVMDLASLPESRTIPCEHHFTQPLSPHRACELDNHKPLQLIDLVEKFKKHSQKNQLIVEGAGGLFVPINRQVTWLDYLQHTGLPVVLVTRTSLGTINHSLLSLEALLRRDIPVVGIIFAGQENPDNQTTILEFYKKMGMSVDPMCIAQFDLKDGLIQQKDAQKLLPLLR